MLFDFCHGPFVKDKSPVNKKLHPVALSIFRHVYTLVHLPLMVVAGVAIYSA